MTAQTLAAVLWDMDGTLIDSEPLWLEAELAMLRRYELSMSDTLHDELVGTGLWEAAEKFRALGVPLSADEIVAEWVAGVEAGLTTGPLNWRPGARELLASLHEAGVPCALVTMSVRSLAEQVVAHLPAGTFSVIVAGDEVEHEKPHPEPYVRAAAALGVSPQDCLALEDSPTGLKSAVAAGTVAVGITNLVPLDSVAAHAVTNTLAATDAAAVRNIFSRLRDSKPHLHEHAETLTGELA